jgi:microcystin-dependent protein
MATTTPNLALAKPTVGGDRNVWGASVNGNADILDGIFKPDGTGSAVGLALGAGKVWNALAGALNVAAGVLLLKDASDPSKVARFDASKIASGALRTFTLPDTSGTLVPTGVPLPFLGTTAPAGFVLGAGRTIGNAASGATERASADTQNLFTLLWPTFTVSGGRGASAAADFAANKTVSLPDLRGRTLVGLDNIGGTAANVLTNYAATTVGAAGGEQSHTLGSAEMPVHSHGVSDPGHGHGVSDPTHSHGYPAGAIPPQGPYTGRSTYGDGTNLATNVTDGASTGIAIVNAATGITVQNGGGGGGHNNVQPFVAVNYIIAL